MSSNLKVVCHDDRLFHVVRAAWIAHPLRSLLQFSILPAILDLGRTCDNAPPIAEG
jgi:hypothetical protein